MLHPNLTDFGYSRDNLFAVQQAMGSTMALVRNSREYVQLCHTHGLEAIYRKAGSDGQLSNPIIFVDRLISECPEADYLQLWNEVGLSDQHSQAVLDAADHANQRGYRVVGFNAATNTDPGLWLAQKSAVKSLLAGGNVPAFHLYLDGTHDSGGYGWRDLYAALGGKWFCTELGYIASIFDANTGWQGHISEEKYAQLLSEWDLPLDIEYFLYSLEHWPTNKADPGDFSYAASKIIVGAIKTFNGKTQPMVTTYDLADYICPAAGNPFTLTSNEACQSIKTSDNWIEFHKNKNCEEFYVTDTVIGRGADTSLLSRDGVHANGTFYVQYSGSQYGCPWAARHMKVGDVFHRNCRVVVYDYTGKVLSDSPNTQSDLALNAYHESITFPNGKSVQNVLEFQWGGDEVYYYAKGYGLVGWKNLKDGSLGNYLSVFGGNIQSIFPHAITRPAPPVDEVTPVIPTYPSPSALGNLLTGTVTKTTDPSGANLRQEPSVNSKVIGTVKVGDTLTYREHTYQGGSYSWYFSDSLSGWIANVISIGPVTTPPIKMLDVPYVSQLGNLANAKNNDCMYASALMWAKYKLKQSGYGDIPLLTVNLISNFIPGDTVMPVVTAEKVLDGLGLDYTYSNGLTLDRIRSEIDSGCPPILLINYKYLQASQVFGHYLIAVGYSATGFYLDDPYLTGERSFITNENLEKALTDVQPFASITHQGFCMN